jgi:hypothetical protein
MLLSSGQAQPESMYRKMQAVQMAAQQSGQNSFMMQQGPQDYSMRRQQQNYAPRQEPMNYRSVDRGKQLF